jgi:hypothetical protein
MSEDAAQLHLRAEACRRLADTSENVDRKELWLERADHWGQLAVNAEKRDPTVMSDDKNINSSTSSLQQPKRATPAIGADRTKQKDN